MSSTGVAMGAAIAASAGIDLGACLVILMLAPTVTVIGYEALGYRHAAEALSDRSVRGCS